MTSMGEVSCDFYIYFILTIEYILYCAFKDPSDLYYDRVALVNSKRIESTEMTIAIQETISKQSVLNMVHSLALSLHLDECLACRFVRHMLPIALEFKLTQLRDEVSTSTYVFIDLGSFFVTFCAVDYINVSFGEVDGIGRIRS